VEVKNLDNGKVVTATVTDRGGFNKYDRIADLSKGLYDALGAKTDKSIIEISYF
jgi:rare lipoprotein A (peptidoglycan hydrolase)